MGFYASVISPFLRSTTFGERLDAALVAFNANLQFAGFMYARSGGTIFSDSEIEEIFAGLDADSISIAKRFMSHQHKCLPFSIYQIPVFFLYNILPVPRNCFPVPPALY